MLNVEIVNWADCADVIENLGFVSDAPRNVDIYSTTVESEEELFALAKKFFAQIKRIDGKEIPINVMIGHGHKGEGGYMLGIDDRYFQQRG